MKQIVVIMENRTGIIADISTLMEEQHINIESIDAQAIGKIGVVRMVVDDYDTALKVFRNNDFNALTEEVFLVKLEDKPGALGKVARIFKDAKIDIKSLRLVERDGKRAIAAISTESGDEARKLVRDILLE
jgi:hypothetical protein